MNWRDYIEQRPDVMMGKPVFMGTRITVEHIISELGRGMTAEEVLEGYPRLTKEHLQAGLLFAAEAMGMNDE